MKTKIIAIILAVAAVISIVAFALTKSEKPQVVTPTDENVLFSLETSDYSNSISVVGTNGEIFLPTDVNGLYYTATLKNEIKFYEYTPNGFSPSALEVKTTNVKLNASLLSIPVKISYVEHGDNIIGYGVFTSDMDSSVKAYPYAFVKIVKAPVGYGEGYLLLADFNKDNFFKAGKTYSEIYPYEIGKTSVSTVLSQNTRMVDRNGTFRQDWSMVTDEFIRNLGNGKYFMSSRYYTQAETGKRTDIMVYSNAYRPNIVAQDIVGTWFVNDEEGMHYLTKDGDGFKSVAVKDDKTKDVIKFSISYEDYLRSGNYVINKHTNILTNLLTGEEKELKGINISKATVFSINNQGTNAVFVTAGEPNVNGTPIQKITFCKIEASKDSLSFAEPMIYDESTDFIWVEANKVMSVRALTDDGSSVGSVIYTFAEQEK